MWVQRETEYFVKRDWTAKVTLIRFNKIVTRRKGYDAADLPDGQISCGCTRYLPVIARSASDEAIQLSFRGRKAGLLRGACHRARIRATRWLAMTGETKRKTPPGIRRRFDRNV